mgnify:CR=1 FL=1
MAKCGQARTIILVPLLVAFSIVSMTAHGERTPKYPDPPRANSPIHIKPSEDRGFESIKFSKRFKIKGWEIGDDIYIGGVKAAGDYGPGLVLDKGRFSWGFNHQGMEFQLRF